MTVEEAIEHGEDIARRFAKGKDGLAFSVLAGRVRELEKQERQWFDGTNWIELEPDEVKRRREEAGRTFSKLPKTADGVTVLPCMELWSWIDRRGESALGMSWATLTESDEPVVAGDTDGYAPLDFQEFYSTREAAEAARGSV